VCVGGEGEKKNITLTKCDILNLVAINNGSAHPHTPNARLLSSHALIVYTVKMAPKTASASLRMESSHLAVWFCLLQRRAGQVHCDADRADSRATRDYIQSADVCR
jgi:hypothetical protein